MFFILYETTNTINGKKYRGVHKTKNLDDGYLGSGKLLLRAIEKYGEENFERKFLTSFVNEDEMYYTEKEYVNEDWIQSENTYNIMLGGKGGWGHIDVTGKNNPFYGKRHTEETKRKLSKLTIGKYSGDNNPMFGVSLSGSANGMFEKKHTDESKLQMGETRRENRRCGKITFDHLRGILKSEETRKKMSESQKRRWKESKKKK